MFLTDSQPGLCCKNVLKIWVNLSLTVLIKKVLIKKKETNKKKKQQQQQQSVSGGQKYNLPPLKRGYEHYILNILAC